MTLISHPCNTTVIVQKLGTRRRPISMRAPAAFSYDATNPFVVTLSWGKGGVWEIGRQQLVAGVVEPMLTATVTVMPRLTLWVEITLRGDDGRSWVLSFDRADVDALLAAAETAVPLGTEGDYLDLDAELACLIAGECGK